MLKTTFFNSQCLPLVVVAEEKNSDAAALTKLALENKDSLETDLLKYGAILFRDFDITSIDEFEDFVRKFSGRPFFGYAGGVSPRVSLKNSVYTSTEYPSHLPLSLHNEFSYSAIFPHHLYFFCLTAPKYGGETTLGDSRRIFKRLDDQTVGFFKEKQVRYERNLSGKKGDGYSWQEAFETDSKSEVENRCRIIGAECEWNSDNSLHMSQIARATITHPITGQEVWFNQADGFHHSALNGSAEKPRLDSRFGDGSSLRNGMLNRIRRVLSKETVRHKWKKGDILILDNILTAHGRMPFKGERKIALAMT